HRGGDERRQMMGRGRVKRATHTGSPVEDHKDTRTLSETVPASWPRPDGRPADLTRISEPALRLILPFVACPRRRSSQRFLPTATDEVHTTSGPNGFDVRATTHNTTSSPAPTRSSLFASKTAVTWVSCGAELAREQQLVAVRSQLALG